MSNHRRHAQRGPRGMAPAGRHGPSSGRARRSLGRLVATPTFAAGACILFAAVLAYGTTQTHLAFRGLGPACVQVSCSAAGRGHAGGPGSHAAGAPGRTYANGYSPARAVPDPDSNPKAGRLTGNMSSVAAAPGLPVVITYRTVRRWPGGFAGMMTITNRSRSAIPSWLLFVHYRRARMDWVRGVRWYPSSSHVPGAGVVAPPRDQMVLRPGASAEFTFRASGQFGPPAGCFFDTARCRFHPVRRLRPWPARGAHSPPRPARHEHGRRGHGAKPGRGMPRPGHACARHDGRRGNTRDGRQCPARGGQHQAHGGQHQAHAAQQQVGGNQRQADGGQRPVGGSHHRAGGTRRQARGSRHQAGGSRHQPRGSRHQGGGSRHRVRGGQRPAPGRRGRSAAG
jgi:hypothetical protein